MKRKNTVIPIIGAILSMGIVFIVVSLLIIAKLLGLIGVGVEPYKCTESNSDKCPGACIIDDDADEIGECELVFPKGEFWMLDPSGNPTLMNK